MANQVGYTRELLVLPFDHRSSFAKKLLGIESAPTPEQTATVADYKMAIYEGFKQAVESGLPKEKMGILTDEQFGTKVLQAAKKEGYTVCLCVEKSGQDEFDFEYGSAWKEHIAKFNPELVKVLVRYNPGDNKDMNKRQAKRLAELSQYLHTTNAKYMFELLVPASKEQMKQCNEDKHIYDLEMRPRLMIEAIHELQDAGVEADVWKLEGLDRESDCEKVVAATRKGGRDKVGTIILGRGENDEKVRQWLSVGAKVPGVIGFAVGRTVFMQPLLDYQAGKITRKEAVDQIAKKYGNFCKLWIEARA